MSFKKKSKKNFGFDLLVFILRSQRESHVYDCEELFTTYCRKQMKELDCYDVDKDSWNFPLEATRAFLMCSATRDATVEASFVICN